MFPAPLPARLASTLFSLVFPCVLAASLRAAETGVWRSGLYPADWTAASLESKSFYEDKLIQDFSHAGYRSDPEDPPSNMGPLFVVSKSRFGADPTGRRASTAAIQTTIDAASASGGGVVYFPAGNYLVCPPEGRDEALLVTASRVVLCGAGADRSKITNTS